MSEQELPGTYAKTDMGYPDYGLWTYRILPEPHLSEMLERTAQLTTYADGKVDSVSFQPCLLESEASQDRRIAGHWDLPNGTWTYVAVFDGHAGEEVAELAVVEVPNKVRQHLESLLQSGTEGTEGAEKGVPVNAVSTILSKSIEEVDQAILDDFMALFPGGEEQISNMTPEEVKALINDGGPNHLKTIRCMRGTTALVALVDPKHENLWIANLGDCQAVIGSISESGNMTGTLLTYSHNGSNADEADRVRKEHPGEAECILRERVLGAIAVTRAIGDFEFKLPAVYTTNVFMQAEPGFRVHSKVEDFVARCYTPPYLSRQADIYHRVLSKSDKYLVLASDGLYDLYRDKDETENKWITSLFDYEGEEQSKALRILRNALGGQDNALVSRYLTVEMEHRWMDDVTILVLDLAWTTTAA